MAVFPSTHKTNALKEGVAAFNSGHYFECHEILEELWRSERGHGRDFYQGLINAAVGLYHREAGNLRGATSQLRKAVSRLSRYPAGYQNIDVAALVTTLRRLLEAPENQAEVRIDPA